MTSNECISSLVKFTAEGEITVSCQTFDEPAGLRDPRHTAVEIIVADTGCGIPPEKLESIFREFEQVESSERNNKESGVGKLTRSNKTISILNQDFSHRSWPGCCCPYR
jgi:signal transduction histidine kinase